MSIKRIYETVKYMTVRQWKYRLFYTARNKLIKRKPTKNIKLKSVKRLPMNFHNFVYLKNLKTADGILFNQIPSISGRVEQFDNDIDWDMKNEQYRLVCFRVNSFRFLFILSNAFKQTGEVKYIEKGFELIDSWISQNFKLISGDKWNAYVIADRLMNWIGFVSEYCSDEKLNYYAKFIYVQANELMKSIEYQLGANHLLSEGRALIAAGAFLNNSKMYQCGKNVLLKEYKVQFLEDGGHYERSVSYHIESLQQYFEAIWIMNYLRDDSAVCFANMIKKSYEFLNCMIGANGEIPLFNDAAIDYPFFDSRDFLSTAKYLYKITPPNSHDGDYFVAWMMEEFEKVDCDWNIQELMDSTGFFHHQFLFESNKYSIYFDAGDNGPDSNLGHTHADALSILFAEGSKNILVDSGVFTYQGGELRNECRSTRAHNTVEIDDIDNAEVWSSFRVGKRGHTKIEAYEHSDDNVLIRAVSDGYEKMLNIPLQHTRELTIQDSNGIFRINDYLEGTGHHKATVRYHIGADCVIKKLDDKTCQIDNKYIIKISEPVAINKCKVASEFGIVKQSYCIESTIHFTDKGNITTIIKIVEESKK